MALSARDKKALLALLEQAQLVYLLTRLPKKQVLDDPKDVARLEDGLAAMRVTARDLSLSLRETHTGVQWDELAAKPDGPDLLWRRAKRLGPQVLRQLRPLLAGEPEAAFMLDPTADVTTKPTAVKTAIARSATVMLTIDQAVTPAAASSTDDVADSPGTARPSAAAIGTSAVIDNAVDNLGERPQASIVTSTVSSAMPQVAMSPAWPPVATRCAAANTVPTSAKAITAAAAPR